MRRRLGGWARRVRTELGALSIAARHPDVPWIAKAVALGVVAYAVSPIDLIPDFLPIVGHLDDAVLLPLGILCARRLVPDEVYAECRADALRRQEERPPSALGVALVVAGWLLIWLLAWIGWRVAR